MSTSFLEALKAKSAEVTPFRAKAIPEPAKPEPEFNLAPMTDYMTDDYGNPLTVRIERVVNKGRLDVFFSLKPSAPIRALLKQRCFTFNPDTKAWYNKDTELNRAFLKHYLNAGFDSDNQQESNTTLQETNIVKRPEMPLNDKISSRVDDDKGTPEFIRFKQQTNALMEALKIDAADLMLRAIDCLYKQEIGDRLN